MISSSKPWVFAAPLCGYTRFPYREILQQYPYDMMYTEMVSVDAMVYKNPGTETIYSATEGQANLGVQVFGSNVEHFLKSIDTLASLNRFQVFDINCGCPVPKVMKTGGGSALLQNPSLIYKIVSALTKEFPHLNITTKMRIGINSEYRPYLEVAKAIEDGGAKLLTVHGRQQNQKYDGPVDFNAIREIKSALKIPVIGNGGIFTPEDAVEMLEKTGVDGIMVARGVIGSPWIATQIKEYIATGTYTEPTPQEKIAVLKMHFEKENNFAPNNGFREFKKTGVTYLKGLEHSRYWKMDISLAHSPEKMAQVIQEMQDTFANKTSELAI